MSNNVNKLKDIIIQGGDLLKKIPKKSDFNLREKYIRDNYRNSEPFASIGQEIISDKVGNIATSILGTKKKTGKSVASGYLKNMRLKQRDNLITQLWSEYKSINNDCEKTYKSWSSEVENVLKLCNYKPSLRKFRNSKLKTKLETKIKWGIDSATQTLNNIETKSEKEKDIILIKVGEPLKGRKILRDFIKKAISYLKIQEPYPTPELLELVEETEINIGTELLIGPFKSNKEKEKFEKHLALLRRTGRDINVLSIESQNASPFHDRYIITRNNAILTGTSLSGLGFRDSTINKLSEWSDIEKRFDEYMIGPITKHRGKVCIRERL